MIGLEFTRRYAMAHRLLADGSGKCATPHGHNEIVTVRLVSDLPLELGHSNSVAPFERLKKRWHQWIDGHVDHSLQLSAEDPLIEYFKRNEPGRLNRLMIFDGDPTTEVLAIAFAQKLAAFLAADGLPFRCERIEVEETPTNRVVLERAWDPSAYKGWSPGRWAARPDMSINDFTYEAAGS